MHRVVQDDTVPAALQAIRTVVAAVTLTGADTSVAADATAGAFAVTLPLAAAVPGKIYMVKKKDATANAVTLTASGADVFDYAGAGTAALAAQNNSRLVVSDGGTVWMVF
jgi:hypothetical protein